MAQIDESQSSKIKAKSKIHGSRFFTASRIVRRFEITETQITQQRNKVFWQRL